MTYTIWNPPRIPSIWARIEPIWTKTDRVISIWVFPSSSASSPRLRLPGRVAPKHWWKDRLGYGSPQVVWSMDTPTYKVLWLPQTSIIQGNIFVLNVNIEEVNNNKSSLIFTFSTKILPWMIKVLGSRSTL